MTLEQTLRGRLVDEFSQHLLTGALRVVADSENPIRLNLFAAAIRELFGHTLDILAPSPEVIACSWYAAEPGTHGPTRRQRAKYATQGGLSDEFILKAGVDVGKLHDEAIAAINQLNKYTHVRPNVIVNDQAEVGPFVGEALSALLGLFESFEECRNEVLQAVYDAIDNTVLNAFISETVEAIDLLATHHYIDAVYIDDVEITCITARTVFFKITGSLGVELRYGSTSDFRHGDGATLDHEFPFEASMSAPVNNMTAFADVRYTVSTREWYG